MRGIYIGNLKIFNGKTIPRHPILHTFVSVMDISLSHRYSKPVAAWLLVGVAMIMIQVLLGGITRLTGSGLSITEWKPIMGTFPPVNQQQWEEAFNKYKQIGQYTYLNADFSLSDFKFIYFWEWLHRVWARLIGVVFLIPFIIFLIQKRFTKEQAIPLLILFLLGGLQGAIGWIMVKSGLNSEDLYVDHIRLAIHFIAALGLLVYTFWFALLLTVPPQQLITSSPLKKISAVVVIILFLQLVYGAFMAGLKAATFAPTWPTINGKWWPDGAAKFTGVKNLTDNPLVVHFIHRGLAYLLAFLTFIWWLKARELKGGLLFSRTKWLPPVIVLCQVVLGILTVLYSSRPNLLLGFGVAHQFFAMLFLLIMVWMLYLVRSSYVKG